MHTDIFNISICMHYDYALKAFSYNFAQSGILSPNKCLSIFRSWLIRIYLHISLFLGSHSMVMSSSSLEVGFLKKRKRKLLGY